MHKEELDQQPLRLFLMFLMLVSWSIFPLLFLLGPEVSDILFLVLLFLSQPYYIRKYFILTFACTAFYWEPSLLSIFLICLLIAKVFQIIGGPTSIILHSFGDLIAKNLFSFIAWKITRGQAQVNTHTYINKQINTYTRRPSSPSPSPSPSPSLSPL
jgi:hypothetical protein